MKNQLCVGMFGTCDGSQWREPFKAVYALKNIPFFDPQKEDWKPEDAEVEAEHLAEDAVVLFPITDESYAIGSLSEIGFSILNAISLDDRRDFVVFITPTLQERLMIDNPALAKASLRGRALVKQHLKKLRLGNVYIVTSLEEMLEVSMILYDAVERKFALRRFNVGQ